MSEPTKKISRQRKWQLRQIEKGLCTLCNSEAVSGYHCQVHLDLCREGNLRRQRIKRGIPIDAPLARCGRARIGETKGPSQAFVHLLGNVPDKEVAALEGVSVTAVWRWRHARGIPRFKKHQPS